jgi:hypothetical protein
MAFKSVFKEFNSLFVHIVSVNYSYIFVDFIGVDVYPDSPLFFISFWRRIFFSGFLIIEVNTLKTPRCRDFPDRSQSVPGSFFLLRDRSTLVSLLLNLCV